MASDAAKTAAQLVADAKGRTENLTPDQVASEVTEGGAVLKARTRSGAGGPGGSARERPMIADNTRNRRQRPGMVRPVFGDMW